MIEGDFEGKIRQLGRDTRNVMELSDIYVKWAEKNGKTPVGKTVLEFLSLTIPHADESDLAVKDTPPYYHFKPEAFARMLEKEGAGTWKSVEEGIEMEVGGNRFLLENTPCFLEWKDLDIRMFIEDDTDTGLLLDWLKNAVRWKEEGFSYFSKANGTIIERAQRRVALEQAAMEACLQEIGDGPLAFGIVADPDGVRLKIVAEDLFSADTDLRLTDADQLEAKVLDLTRKVREFHEVIVRDGLEEDWTCHLMEEIPADVSLLMEDVDQICFRIARRRFCETFPPRFLRRVELYETKLIMNTRGGQYVVTYRNFTRSLAEAMERMGHTMRRPLRKKYGI